MPAKPAKSANPAKPAKNRKLSPSRGPSDASMAAMQRSLRSRARQLGLFLVVVGLLGVTLNLSSIMPMISSGEATTPAYVLGLVATMAGLAITIVGLRMFLTGDDVIPE